MLKDQCAVMSSTVHGKIVDYGDDEKDNGDVYSDIP